jgi:hypothetical protein
MHIFDYCEEGSEVDLSITDEWHEEQQTKYNFARYEKIDWDLQGKFRKLNE